VYAGAIEKQESLTKENLPNPPSPRGQTVSWPDLLQFVKALRDLISESTGPLELRLRRCIALAALCREAVFDRVYGARLREFLDMIVQAVCVEVEPNEAVDEPTWTGRMIFRRTLAVYVRKDTGVHKGISRHGRLALMWAAWRFAKGTGRVPRLHAMIPPVTFEQIEEPRGALPTSVDEMLTRYYAVKLESLQFCGKTNFDTHIWDGLDSLIFTFPAICWLARAFHDQPREEAFIRALRIVDDNFGYNPLLKGRMQKWGTRLLSKQNELEKLVAWYSR